MNAPQAAEPLVAALEDLHGALDAAGHADWARWCTTILALARRGDRRAASRVLAAVDGGGDLGTVAAEDEGLAIVIAAAHDAAVAFDRAGRRP